VQHNEYCCLCNNIRAPWGVDRSFRRKEVDAWRELLICHSRIVRAVERELEKEHLVPLSSYDILLHLRYAPNKRRRFRDLNGEIVLSRSALSRCLDRLAEAKLVTKLDCPEDPRGLIIELAPAGETALKSAWPIYRRQIHELFGTHFSDKELDFIVKKFSALARVLPGEL
jgi:DNA-binding MarR family transcriptional regulator